jgi:hypothetical protein
VAIYYVFFAFAVMYYEIQASWLFMKELHHPSGASDDSNGGRSFRTIVCRAIVLRQTYQFSGISDTVRMTNVVNEDQIPDHKRTTLYTRMTIIRESGPCGTTELHRRTAWYETVPDGQHVESREDILLKSTDSLGGYCKRSFRFASCSDAKQSYLLHWRNCFGPPCACRRTGVVG